MHAKPRVFLPWPDELSVFRVAHLPDATVWRIGERHVARPQGRNIHGKADVKADECLKHELAIDADNWPRHHATVIGWPPSKDARMSIAQQIAAAAVVTRSPAA